MTLRQVLAALWQRKWLILSTIVVAMLAAIAYLQVRAETYESTAIARTNAVVTQGIVTGQVGGAVVRFDPSMMKDPVVLGPAATASGDTEEVLSANFRSQFESGSPTGRLFIFASADSPDQAQLRAQSTLDSYSAYLELSLDEAEADIQARLAEANAEAARLQALLATDPTNQIIAADLTRAIGQIGSLRGELDGIASAGSALTITTQPAGGSPTFPSVLIVLLVTLSAAIVAGIGIALIYDQFDDRLRNEKDVERLTESQVLGSLPFDKSVRSLSSPLPIDGRRRSSVTEGIRALRASLQVLLPRTKAVLVVTSVEPGDGKTFVSANLALAWARSGKQVILVGGDLRKPDLSEYYGESADGAGLAELLEEADDSEHSAEEAVAEALRATGHRRLRVLPSGSEPRDPADLLAAPRLAAVVEALREQADIVIIDSPPAMRLVDASLLALHADGVLVMASVRRTHRERLTETIDSLRLNDVRILGVAVNRSRRAVPRSYANYLTDGAKTDAAAAASSTS